MVLLGISKERRLLTVMYTGRNEAVRMISARRATSPERRVGMRSVAQRRMKMVGRTPYTIETVRCVPEFRGSQLA